MHDWRSAGFFVMTCFVAFGVSASGTGGGSANGATSESLTGTSELLCLGITPQSGYRAVLERLAALPFVAEIREALLE